MTRIAVIQGHPDPDSHHLLNAMTDILYRGCGELQGMAYQARWIEDLYKRGAGVIEIEPAA